MVHFKTCSSSSVDRGWAWVILFGSTVEYFITVGMFKTFGIFFVEYQRKYSTTSSVISLVLAVQTIVGSVSSLLIMGVGMRYIGKRPLIMVAALFGLCSNIGNAFAPDPFFLFFSQSTLYALAVSCAHLPCTILLGEYFEKRRGLANSVANLGASIGGLAWPPLVVFLIGEYGLRGSLIIVSGLYLQFLPIGLLMRKIELDNKVPEIDEKQNRISNIVDNKIAKEMTFSESFDENTYVNKTFDENDDSLFSKKSLGEHSNRNEKSQSIEMSEDGINIKVKSSIKTVNSETISSVVQPKCDRDTSSKMDKPRHVKNQGKLRSICQTLFDWSLLRNGRFLLLMTSSFLVAAASALPITFIPPFAADKGLEMSSLGYLVAIAGASDIFGNIVFIFISDNKKVQRYHMFSIAMTANGVLCLFASFYTNFMSLAIFGILHTVLGGAYFCLINVLVVDFIGLNNIQYGVVIASVTKDVSIAITSALVGMIRDITGSYVGGFYIFGTCSIVGGLLLLVKPFVSVQN